MHVPGMKVVIPSNPYDAKGLLISAIRDNNPVLYLEHKLLYGAASPGGGKALVAETISAIGGDVPEEPYHIPLGEADVKRAGSDVTVVATGVMVHHALSVAEKLGADGISLEVVDPRSLVPLDKETILSSVAKCHRAVVVSEDVMQAGVCAELAAVISSEGFDELDAPVERVGALSSPIPFAPPAESRVIPQSSDIELAVRRVLKDF